MFIIDIILVVIVALIVFLSAKRGFVLTVFDLVSGIIACILARFVAAPVAQFVYDAALKETVLEFLTQQFASIESAASDFFADPSQIFGFLPENVVNFAESTGLIDLSSFAESIMANMVTVEQLEANVVGPVVYSIVRLICYGVISFVFLIVLRIIGHAISKLVKITKLGEKLNTILGAVCGALKGLLYIFIIAVVLVVISCFSETLTEYTSVSYICKLAGSLIGL